jgi:cytidylate kinase
MAEQDMTGGIPRKGAWIITIDGPVGAGKSAVGKMLAQRLGYRYIDSGAMYRAVACEALRRGIALEDEDALSGLIEEAEIEFTEEKGRIKIYICERDISEEIRTPGVGQASSRISTLRKVREKLVALQRQMGIESEIGVIMEGRDIGTVVFPDADIKFFLESSLEERARRRHNDLMGIGLDLDFAETLRDVQARDERDTQRELSPLKPSADSIRIDSTHMDMEEVVEFMLREIKDRL